MSFSEDGCLGILDDWIQDEDKVITYRHLSLALGVPCNQAKSMLQSYVRKLRASESSHIVHVVYLVTGNLSEEEMVVKLVPEAFLESTKSQLSSITSVHIYSISKSDIRNPFLLQKASTLIREDISEILKYSQITNSHIKRRTLKYKSATHANAPLAKPEKPAPTSTKHPNDLKSNSFVATNAPIEGKETNSNLNDPPSNNKIGKPSNSSNRPKKTQNKLHFSNSLKNPNKKNVTTRLDEGVKRIQITRPTTPPDDSSSSSSSSSGSEMDLGPRRYFPPSLPQEVVESHGDRDRDRPKMTGFLEDDSDEDFPRTDPSIPVNEYAPMPSQVSQEPEISKVPHKVSENVPENVSGKKRKRVKKPVSECYVNAQGALVTKTKFMMVSTTDESEPETEFEKELKKVKKSNATKQSSLNNFFKN